MTTAAAAETAAAPQSIVKHRIKPEDVSPSLKGIKYVIFPNQKFAQYWDFLMILVIIYYALYIPFHLGISGGYLGLVNKWWLGFNLAVNTIFFIDTFLVFFRAYRDDRGVLIYSLKRIRVHYIKSGWFFLNLLACIPGTIISQGRVPEFDEASMDAALHDTGGAGVFFLFEMFKLFRLLRFRRLLNESLLVKQIWEKINIETALALKFTLLISLISHWIACLWSLIAFLEARSFGAPMLESLNWISNWYNGSYVEGGLNPIGWENYLDRYWLCLFWAIQSITSIGYGNIAPVTTAEFAYANFLMLACGIFWAYVIGALVDAVSAMGSLSKEYVDKMDLCNQMVRDFTVDRLPQSVTGTPLEEVKVSKRVRRFITESRDKATTKSMDYEFAETLEERYPTLSIVSPELKKLCALHLAHTLIETVPYLSSKFLSPEEQAHIALNSYHQEFCSGEKFKAHSEHGRGILIFRLGFGFTVRKCLNGELRWRKGLNGHPADVDEVLVDDDYYPERQLTYHFAGFTKVFFIPRSVIMEVLEKNPRAWNECARYRFVMASIILKSDDSKRGLSSTRKIMESFASPENVDSII